MSGPTPRTDGMLERVLLGTATTGDVNHLARVLERELYAHTANSIEIASKLHGDKVRLMSQIVALQVEIAELRAALGVQP